MTDSGLSTLRQQRTIARSVSCQGVGFITGEEITVHFHPAAEDHGIVFQRTDQPDLLPIPALIEYCIPRQRRTAIENGNATLELTEHALAALAGMQIDNCLVEVNGPELPGGDGSALIFVEPLLTAGSITQNANRALLIIDQELQVENEQNMTLSTTPVSSEGMTIEYHLNYGADSPIVPQALKTNITPDFFLSELASCRTFVLQEEVEALKALGYGKRTTYQDLLVFGPDGVIENELRFTDECVRHKILDCIGYFALAGCDLQGGFLASRSGHELNRELIRQLRAVYWKASGSGSDQQAA